MPDDADIDPALWDALRQARMRMAKEASVPAYIVCGDRSLLDLAVKKPADIAGMAAVWGFGERKAERYGQGFIEALASFRRD